VTPADPDAVAGAVFAALADPTRRQVVRALSEHGGASASALAHDMPVTRQAVAKHLTALRDAGLVVAEPAGRETRYRLTPAPFAEAMRWMAATGARWDVRLARLERRLGGSGGGGATPGSR
jgi:DNA-binding transcriptional ArsR family regulator